MGHTMYLYIYTVFYGVLSCQWQIKTCKYTLNEETKGYKHSMGYIYINNLIYQGLTLRHIL